MYAKTVGGISKPKLISEIKYEEQNRKDTNNEEFNRVLGGGLVPVL